MLHCRHDLAARERTLAELKIRRTATGKLRKRKPPKMVPPDAIGRAYARELLARVQRMRAAFAPLLAALPGLIARVQRERARGDALAIALGVFDAGETREAKALIENAKQQIAGALNERDLEALSERFARETSTYQRVQFNKVTRAVLGADLFLPDRRLEPIVEGFINSNVGLIKNIGEQLAANVESATMAALTSGTLHGDLAKQLESKFGFAENRARLIARDQIGKVYGQINATRQREIGVTSFIWRDVGDGRVRPEHRHRNGHKYTYEAPPSGELPGEPVLCRCYAEPVFDDILAELEIEPARSSMVAEAPLVEAEPVFSWPAQKLNRATLATGADANGVTNARAMRAHLNQAIAPHGLHNRDAGWASNLRDTIEVQTVEQMGFSGGYHGWRGEIVMSDDVVQRFGAFADEAAKGTDFRAEFFNPQTSAERIEYLHNAAEGYRTFVHESIHGHGPDFMDAFGTQHPVAIAVEEAVTEIAARRVTREAMGLPLDSIGTWGPDGPQYAEYIIPLRDGVGSVISADSTTAYLKIEEAALKYKRRRGAFKTGEESLDAFLDDIDLNEYDAATQAQARANLRSYFLQVWPNGSASEYLSVAAK